MSTEFDGRVALVTGGSRGIGRATALRLARDGSHVAISYASRAREANDTTEAIKDHGRRALAVRCNVADPADVANLVRQTTETLGPIDLLVHCGAISNLSDHTELSFDRWREMIEINLNGTYLIVFAVKDGMIERSFGRIVTIASIAALLPRKMQIHYAAAKAGVMAMTRCCAEAFAPHGVRTNCVAPGLIDTEMARVLSPVRLEELKAATPMGRLGTPDELAAVIRFLLSDESSFMTGQTVVASGGRMMMA